jgi:hypothetical protein
MFCSNCGNTVNEKLKYCNSCGERLGKNKDDLDTPGKMLDGILDTIFWTAAGSLGILVGLVAVLIRGGMLPEYIAIIAVAYLATLFGITFTLLRQVPKLIDARLKSKADEPEAPQSVRLRAPNTAQLEGYREPAVSVTDHTTRTLDEVRIERR